MPAADTLLRGVQTPRIMSAPDFHSTAGQEVIELAEMAGLFLEPWQQLVIRHMFGEKPDGTMSAFEVAVIVSRQNGKGAIIEAAELGWLFLLKEPLIMHTAHEVKTSDEAFRRIKTLILNTPALTKRCKKPRDANGQQAIETLTGQRLRFIARSKGSGRGFSAPRLVLDEAYDLDERHMSALFPTMSAMADPQIIYMSSAPRAEDEVLNALCDRGAAGTSERLAYFEWSADPSLSLDDREGWAQANPALGYGRVTEEFIAMERDALPEASFARERAGIREDPNAGGVIPWVVWNRLEDASSSPSGSVAFAVDTSPDRHWSSISSAGGRADGKLHVELVDRRTGTHWVASRLAQLASQHGPCAVVVDPGAAAGSLLPDLAEAGVEVVTPTMREVGQACGAFFDAVVDPDAPARLVHLAQEPLDEAVRAARKRPLGDLWAWDRKSSASDITPLVSSTLALWGWSKHHNDNTGGWMVIL